MRKYIVIILFFLAANSFAQNKALHLKSYVKEKELILRWVPSSKEIFELGVKNGYKITRYTITDNKLSNPITVAENIRPYAYDDSINWITIIKKNSNAILILNSIYENISSENIPQKEKAEQQAMIYGLTLLSCDFDADIAKSCGLYFKDSTISNNKIYSYKIEINNTPAALKISPAISKVNTAILSINPEINNLNGTFKNKIVTLQWKATNFTNDYGGYNIERSADNIIFNRINSSPVILITSQYEKKKELISYSDTLPNSKVQYYYRIKGINHFGEESSPSNIISGTGYEELQSVPVIDTLKIINNQKVRIHWRMKDEKENNLPKEYILVRSEKDNGKYTVLTKSTLPGSYLDEVPKQSNYYKIGAITNHYDTIYSFSSLALIADTIPPSVPTGIMAKVDTLGNVTITWNKNPENDIQGYKVFKSNSLSEEFVQINNEFARNNRYEDKLNLNTLTKNIYYSIAATDNNYNNSELCKPIEVKRPDTIPPIPAIINNLQIMQNGIKTSWIPSNSDDVKQNVLYRQEEKTNVDTKVFTWRNSDTATSFIDTLLEFGQGYRYKIATTDESDNVSISNIPYMFFETGFRKKITGIELTADRNKRSILLKWNYPEKEVEKFIIYRAKGQEPLTIIKTISFTSSFFEDNSLNISNTYEYRVKAVFNNGAESILSDAVRAEY